MSEQPNSAFFLVMTVVALSVAIAKWAAIGYLVAWAIQHVRLV